MPSQSAPPTGSRYFTPPGPSSQSGWRWTRWSRERGSAPVALDQTKNTLPQACTRTPTAAPAGLQEALAGLAFGDNGAAREEGLIGEAADRTARGDGREERRKIRVTGKARVP